VHDSQVGAFRGSQSRAGYLDLPAYGISANAGEMVRSETLKRQTHSMLDAAVATWRTDRRLDVCWCRRLFKGAPAMPSWQKGRHSYLMRMRFRSCVISARRKERVDLVIICVVSKFRRLPVLGHNFHLLVNNILELLFYLTYMYPSPITSLPRAAALSFHPVSHPSWQCLT